MAAGDSGRRGDVNVNSRKCRPNADTSEQDSDRQEADRMKRLESLKTAIARGEYRVPAAAVADAILASRRKRVPAIPLAPRSRHLRVQ